MDLSKVVAISGKPGLFLVTNNGGGKLIVETKPQFADTDVIPIRQIFKIIALSPWAFVGFESISHAAGEFRFPMKRALPIMGLALVAGSLADVSLRSYQPSEPIPIAL